MNKKLLFATAAMLLIASNSFAQLVVDSTGYVGIGTEKPTNMLNINRIVPQVSTLPQQSVRLYSKSNSWTRRNIGLESRVVGVAGGYSCALLGVSDSTYASAAFGVFGSSSPTGTGSSAGVYGSTYYYANADSSYYFGSYYGRYAGFFQGNMRVTGSTFSSAYLTPSGNIYSPRSATRNLANESDMRVTDKLQLLQAVQFQRDMTTIEQQEARRATLEETEEELALSPIQYGLVAEQLKEVYPELIYEDRYGNISINYIEMVPLLVQSINELSSELAELKGTSSKKAKTKKEITSIEDTSSEVDMVRMDQNKPNPFSESTVITLNIPKDTKTATILIYDLSGKQVKSIPVNERGKTDITVYASDLTSGMYIYNLVVDGQVKVTRRMMVSEV